MKNIILEKKKILRIMADAVLRNERLNLYIDTASAIYML